MRRLSFVAILLPLALFALSCSEENPPTGPEGWQELTSPFNTLWDVKYCFDSYQVEMGIIKRLSTLFSDQFIFYFEPIDGGDTIPEHPFPEFWTKDQLLPALNNVFNTAYSITFEIPILDKGEQAFGRPHSADTIFMKNNIIINFVLFIDATQFYQAQGFCDFKFTKGEDGLWQVSEWRDHTGPSSPPTYLSLGEIFYMYSNH
jgi:hypothetical protein